MLARVDRERRPRQVKRTRNPTVTRKIKIAIGAALIAVPLLAGCADDEANALQGAPAKTDAAIEMCTEPRPEICTREYDPVCALLADGEWRTYATGCVACSDPKVTGYRPQPC